MLRRLSLREKRQKGCEYCKDKTLKHRLMHCPYSECPYKVLDKYDSFEAFMESEDSKILVQEFFTTVSDCYDYSRINLQKNSSINRKENKWNE